MRIFITLISGLVINFTFSQFLEDFGTSAAFPSPWEGQTVEFQIQNEELRLNASQAGNALIYLPSSFFYFSETEIRLKIRLNFSPSGNNRLNLFIFSDSVDVHNAQNALYIQFGESGSDDAVSLRGKFNGNDQELLRGQNGKVASSFELEMRLKAQNDSICLELWNSNLNVFEEEWKYADTSSFNLNILALDCQFTSSNSDNFYFDDIYLGPIIYDTIPPQVDLISALDSNSLEIQFSEPIDTSLIDLNQIQIDNPIQQTPHSFGLQNTRLVLHFPQVFSNNQSSELRLDTLFDLAGNVGFVDTNLLLLFGEYGGLHDIEITEIMSDPTPSKGLPECEYIELYNASSKWINLADLLIGDLSDTVQIDSLYYFAPNSYCLLVPLGCSDSFAFSNSLEMDLPSLNNEEDWIVLLNRDSLLIDSIFYSNDWHLSDKDDGGFSLEKAELGVYCGQENWLSTQDSSGGTAGSLNSWYGSPWNYPLAIVDWLVPHENLIQLQFNKPIANSLIGSLISCNYLVISKQFEERTISLNLGPPVFPGDLVEVDIQNMIDCFGNQLDTLLEFQVPFRADSNDLIINEILFDPASGGTDFVELYNKSDKIINLVDLRLANRVNDTVANEKPIVSSKYLLKPKEYTVISKDSNWLQNVFETDMERKFIQVSALPSFPNDAGEVLLVNTAQNVIDEVHYDVNMHYPLLDDFENKSLERISFQSSSLNVSNWNTASGNVNYGTPGYENSQEITEMSSNLEFDLLLDYFSPNNDGDKDNLPIVLNLERPGMVHLKVFNINGQEILRLIDGEYLSGEIIRIWDGLDTHQNLANSGIYIFHFQVIEDTGRKYAIKKTAYLKR